MTMQGVWDVDRGGLREGKAPGGRASEAHAPSFSLEAYLPVRRAQVEALLLGHLDGLSPDAPPLLRRAVRYSLLTASQRMRPVLCLAMAEAVAGARVPHPVVADAACALEFLQTCSFIDDAAFALGDGAPFGESLATQAGEALILEALALVTRGPERVRTRLARELATGTGLMGTTGEQLPDLANDRATRLEYLRQLRWMKTHGFIRASCRMGALAAGGDADALARADCYGDAVGLAFLVGSDLRARRPSFATLLGVEKSRALALQKVAEAIAAIEPLEGPNGPLAAIARSTPLSQRSEFP